jgi:hypothetical protein
VEPQFDESTLELGVDESTWQLQFDISHSAVLEARVWSTARAQRLNAYNETRTVLTAWTTLGFFGKPGQDLPMLDQFAGGAE